MDSHADTWLWPRAQEAPQDHGDDVAAGLRAAHSSLLTGLAWIERRRPAEMGHALAAALDHAARLAETLDAADRGVN
ncbi:hypothetical protein [Streptomyces sp. CAU 1734]|uniref:hypothetical protein n=1 Tax=Streptomyces sp. CAU 1734 TaxID=3140360 RepID=UPI0032619DA7